MEKRRFDYKYKTNLIDNDRIALIGLYSQKSNAHIGYLIATSLALIGLSNMEILTIIHFNVIILFIISLILMSYFLGRAMYFSQLIEAVTVAKPYTLTEFKIVHNKEYLENNYDKFYDLSTLYLLKRMALDFITRKGKYKPQDKLPLTIRNKLCRLLEDNGSKIFLAVIIFDLILLNYTLDSLIGFIFKLILAGLGIIFIVLVAYA